MNFLLPILFISYVLSYTPVVDDIISIVIRDSKLIAIYRTANLYNTKVRIYELKEGTTADIFNSRKTFDFGHSDGSFTLVQLDTPENFPENKNKLWVKFMQSGMARNPAGSPFMNFLGYIDLDNMSLENDSDFIKFPTHENFPVKGYTMNTITNEFGSALYITGGKLYSKKDSDYLDNNFVDSGLNSNKLRDLYRYQDSYLDSNSFYKYNFTSKEWIDMTYSANGKLKPISKHKSVVIDNRYLVILGGIRHIIYNSTSNHNYYDQPGFEYNSLYNLTIFDTYSNSWENVNIQADIFDTHITTLEFDSFFPTVYKDKIIVLSGYAGENRSKTYRYSGYLGILDLKTKNWIWTPLYNEDGSVIGPDGIYGEIIVFNNQLIICSDVLEDRNRIRIHILDLISKKMISTLRLSNLSNDTDTIKKNGDQIQSKALPAYVIVLIAKKPTSLNVKTKSNGSIREVWANHI
ncbi:hypothetical protein CONCODRAFT_13126 [Conidiobolus coronatus NRRL 28638]|uniref:Galactose oxidase n=1 Tax=Conidiobolus coronatus (strain ATCC 28846 / CBS 209.66 / NRRL 28638) TaxID=796925 RepID=A0A137NRH1_CONC2|nr:hypothetical protein CONCODRAFT_13126 [Conidiobolus coronatus NRRL 28638]|eukprot:KXN65322.1 hypothetical protein CONCODRAFT_13126 [Conidiobolus coronatus NRRL 28638]